MQGFLWHKLGTIVRQLSRRSQMGDDTAFLQALADVSFSTSCAPALQPRFDRAVAMFHSLLSLATGGSDKTTDGLIATTIMAGVKHRTNDTWQVTLPCSPGLRRIAGRPERRLVIGMVGADHPASGVVH